MRTTLLVTILVAASAVNGEESRPSNMREKLHAKVIQSLPPSPSTKPPEGKEDSGSPVITMKPMIVSESNRARDLDQLMAREKVKKEDERFSGIKGGTILKKDIGKVRIELGSWSDGSGIEFLRVSW